MLTAIVNVLPYGARRTIRHVPGLAPLQRWLVANFLSDRPFVHQINAGPAAGLRFEVTLPEDKAVWAGTYEHGFTTLLANSVVPGMVCCDIGGFRGYMSGVMALAGASKVMVFEPLPANQRTIARLKDLNPALPIQLFSHALGDQDGHATLRVMPDSSMGKLSTSSFQQQAGGNTEIPIEIRQLDSLVQSGDIPLPGLLKIDVEGAEMDVLRGAGQVLRRAKPIIFLEAHGEALEAECWNFLTGLDYRVRRLESHTPTRDAARHLVCVP